MARPKSSVIGFVDLGISGLNARKINKIDKSVGSLSTSLYNSNLRIESELESIRRAQIAGLYGIAELHSTLENLDQTQNEILKELKRQDEKDDLGDLRCSSKLKRNSKIISLSEDYLEYSVMLAEDLKSSLIVNELILTDSKDWIKTILSGLSRSSKTFLKPLQH